MGLSEKSYFIRDNKHLIVPKFYDQTHNKTFEDFVIVIHKSKKFSRCDGDEAQIKILQLIDIKNACKKNKDLLIIDVGGLYGDFGLRSGIKGCKTVIFEPMTDYSELIARSVEINHLENIVTVRNEAVSIYKNVLPLADNSMSASNEKNSIPGVRLDDIFRNDQIFFLKVDVEGYEGDVLETAKKLFLNKQIQHAVFEYSPIVHMEAKNATNYRELLPTLYSLGKFFPLILLLIRISLFYSLNIYIRCKEML